MESEGPISERKCYCPAASPSQVVEKGYIPNSGPTGPLGRVSIRKVRIGRIVGIHTSGGRNSVSRPLNIWRPRLHFARVHLNLKFIPNQRESFITYARYDK